MHQDQKLKDSRDRAWRFAPPEDDGASFSLNEADWLILQLLDDHGPLPTSYLWHKVQAVRKDRKGFQKRLRKAYCRANTPDNGAYLTRPPQQKAAYRADRQDLTHDITDTSRKALERRGLPVHPLRFDPMHHRFMNACMTASFRFAAEEAGLDFVRFKDIFARHTFPSDRREVKNPFAFQTNAGELIPDDLNSLAYPGETKYSYRFFAWEQDRATETLDAIEFKLRCYIDMLRTKSYRDAWGITNLHVLIVTTGPQRMRNIMDRLEKLTRKEPDLRQFFLFKHKRIFGEEWIVPPIMFDVLTDPWERVDKEPLLLSRE